MCEPISDTIAIATAVTSIGSTLLGASAQNKQHNAVVKEADAAATNSQNALSEREGQDEVAAKHDIGLADDQAMSAESTARLSAMEAGVTGNSENAVVGSVEAGRSRYVTSVNENLDMEQEQLEQERLGVDAQRQSRINGAPKADPLATGLQILGAGVNLFGTLNGRKPA